MTRKWLWASTTFCVFILAVLHLSIFHWENLYFADLDLFLSGKSVYLVYLLVQIAVTIGLTYCCKTTYVSLMDMLLNVLLPLFFVLYLHLMILSLPLTLTLFLLSVVFLIYGILVLKGQDKRRLWEAERRLNPSRYMAMAQKLNSVWYLIYRLRQPAFYLMGCTALCFLAATFIIPQIQSVVPVAETPANLLVDFQAAHWDGYSLEERISILQAIERVEAGNAGRPEAKIVTKELDADTGGYYNHAYGIIVMNQLTVSTSDFWEILDVLFHEQRHAYQYAVVESVNWKAAGVENNAYFALARSWRDNQKDYIRCADDRSNLDAYLEQPIEKDAYAYAEERVAYYRERYGGMIEIEGHTTSEETLLLD